MPGLGGETGHFDMPSQLSGMWRRGGRHAAETRTRQKEINILLGRFPDGPPRGLAFATAAFRAWGAAYMP